MARTIFVLTAVLLSAPLWTYQASALTFEKADGGDSNAARYADPDEQQRNFDGRDSRGNRPPLFQFNIAPPRGNSLFGPQRDGRSYAPGTGLVPLMDVDRDRDRR